MSYYIAVEGVIGVGKTTLARYLQDALNTQLVIEVFEENPFLAKFYEERTRYAFQTQVFFLLSRYHQQRRLAQLARPLVSDYIFDKDHLFARQNLQDDELLTYEQVYEALAENIAKPDLVVYLRADTDVLMSRIALRDRPYERNMDVNYIDGLRIAYDNFFSEYLDAPILLIDTNNLDFVRSEADRAIIIQQVRGAVGVGPRQAALPGLDTVVVTSVPPVKRPAASPSPEEKTLSALQESARRLSDFQMFHQTLDRLKNFDQDLLLNFAKLQEEIGELATELVGYWQQQRRNLEVEPSDNLRHELADVLAYILKIANYTGIDLEASYLEKMLHNQHRTWSET